MSPTDPGRPGFSVFAAGLQSESNTFSPLPTGMNAFVEGEMHRGREAVEGPGTEGTVARLWSDLCTRDGHRFTPSLFALAHPGGPTVQTVYEALRDEILDDLRRCGPVDIALLFLHGAMVADRCDDCQLDLVRRVRALVGEDCVIGVELDPHCHLSRNLVDEAQVVVLMKEYPHDDFLDCAERLYELCVAARRGAIDPVAAIFDCRMVGFYPTTEEPMRSLVAAMRAAEREPGVLSVSFAHGFPWGDMPESGSRMLALSDGNQALAQSVARRVGKAVYTERRAMVRRFPPIDEALDAALAVPGLVVLADVADNPGGGAPGDNVTLLRRMIERGIERAAVGALWDPVVARLCADAGVGATLSIRLGGKMGPASGDPLDVVATVRGVDEDHWQIGLGGATTRLGTSVWIEVAGIELVVASVRVQTFEPRVFTGLGIDLPALRMAAVKSSQHFRSRFEPISSNIIWVGTPGVLDMDFANLPYRRKKDMNYFPRTPDPLELDRAR